MSKIWFGPFSSVEEASVDEGETCPISLEPLSHPVYKKGNTYYNAASLAQYVTNPYATDPITRVPFTQAELDELRPYAPPLAPGDPATFVPPSSMLVCLVFSVYINPTLIKQFLAISPRAYTQLELDYAYAYAAARGKADLLEILERAGANTQFQLPHMHRVRAI